MRRSRNLPRKRASAQGQAGGSNSPGRFSVRALARLRQTTTAQPITGGHTGGGGGRSTKADRRTTSRQHTGADGRRYRPALLALRHAAASLSDARRRTRMGGRPLPTAGPMPGHSNRLANGGHLAAVLLYPSGGQAQGSGLRPVRLRGSGAQAQGSGLRPVRLRAHGLPGAQGLRAQAGQGSGLRAQGSGLRAQGSKPHNPA